MSARCNCIQPVHETTAGTVIRSFCEFWTNSGQYWSKCLAWKTLHTTHKVNNFTVHVYISTNTYKFQHQIHSSNYTALHTSTKPEFGSSVISVYWTGNLAVVKSTLDNSSNTAMRKKCTWQAGFQSTTPLFGRCRAKWGTKPIQYYKCTLYIIINTWPCHYKDRQNSAV